MHECRVLIVDDTPQIHADLRKLFGSETNPTALNPSLALELGSPEPEGKPAPSLTVQMDSAYQGEEGVAMLQAAVLSHRPYTVAIVDLRMPPGWDGLVTIERMLQICPELQIILCTGFSDYSWDQIHARLGRLDNLLILMKPFDAAEARQMVWALNEKWHLAKDGDRKRSAMERKNEELENEVLRRTQVEKILTYNALHDPLTDLPNRALISDRIERCLGIAKRDREFNFAVLFVDLDQFKVVNDSLGHQVGDQLLVQVSQRILRCTRQTDCVSLNMSNTAARLGGDEFLILLEGVKTRGDAMAVAERTLKSLSEPIEIKGNILRIGASIGVAFGSSEYDDAMEIIRDADTALYRAKSNGKSTCVMFDSELRQEAIRRLRVETELRSAIENGELFLQYQPIVRLSDQSTVGFEALVRWRHPTQGVIPPSEFVPIAEETGLIFPLGEWVLRTACTQTASWQKKIPGCKDLFINVNFSSKQLNEFNCTQNILRVLEESGLDRSGLHVELTESILVNHSASPSRNIQQIKENGIELHIDDFGTGFSSLSYIDQLPVSAIKIDRAFIRGLVGEPYNVATIKSVIEMSRARNLKVVAGGIELVEQLTVLQSLGCDFGQGFYFSRPMDPEAIEHSVLPRMALLSV